ncbi:MAG: ATP-binding cassette domain-containing protein [Myxococcales bacterium]|nr:ATP-binding cassette domain-containing protein [Myxococcales bacterium]
MTVVVDVERLTVPGRVEGVSFQVEQGALHALVGPNGSGKSTVLDALLGLVPFTGKVAVTAARVAVVPQRLEVPAALPLTVLELFGASRTSWPVVLGVGGGLREQARKALEEVGLAGALERPLSKLSGGELRRVLLANALCDAPELLLLDEPEAGLDAASAAVLGDALRGLTGRLTTLWISHDAARVEALATKVTRLSGAAGAAP